MVVDVVQNYLNLINGLTRMTREKALATARVLLHQAGLEDVANGAGERVSKLAEEILVANRANRELVEHLIAGEVDKAAARWGFVRNDDVTALREEVAELRAALVLATTTSAGAAPTAARKRPGRRPTASPGQQPPLGGVPDPAGVSASHPELVPSEPLPYQPGPIQPTATSPISPTSRAATSKRTTSKRTASSGTTTRATAKKSARPAAGETPPRKRSSATPVGQASETPAAGSAAVADGEVE